MKGTCSFYASHAIVPKGRRYSQCRSKVQMSHSMQSRNVSLAICRRRCSLYRGFD